MRINFDSALTLASEKLLVETYNRFEAEEDTRIFVELSSSQISDLAQRVLAFPDDDISILLLHYALGFDCNDISEFLKQDNIKGKLRYADQLFSTGMGLSESEVISKVDMRSACEIALEEYTKSDVGLASPHYSRSFMKAMRRIKAIRRYRGVWVNVMQKAAIILLAVGISFGITVSVNAEFREKVYRWLIETFPQFSYFGIMTDTPDRETSFEELLLYRPTYIPDGYSEIPTENYSPIVSFIYDNSNGDMLTIIGRLSDDEAMALNTEGAEVEISLFHGEDAFYWVKDGLSYYVFILDGYKFSIVGQCERNDIVRIAENVKVP
jgi:hypothetical protein